MKNEIADMAHDWRVQIDRLNREDADNLLAALIDAAFAKVREECAERADQYLKQWDHCPSIKPSREAVRRAILGAEAMG